MSTPPFTALAIVARNARNQAQRLLHSPAFDTIIKVVFVLLCIPWLISIIFFSIFDTKCIVLEHASVINCSQDFFISNPRQWVFAWLCMSLISSALLILIIRINHNELNYRYEKAKRIHKKGSFFSLIFLLVVSSIYYFVRMLAMGSQTIGLSISIVIFLWSPVIVLVVCCLNYLPRVRWRKVNVPDDTLARRMKCLNLEWWKECFDKNSNFIIYWLALFLYFVEVTCKLVAIMLDVAHDVAPLIQNKFPDESGKYWGAMVVLIGFRMAFHARLLSFFWQKIFHGEKDLLTEPSEKLQDEPPRALASQTNQQQENRV